MARKWFLTDNTAGLGSGDLAILNRAARHLDDAGIILSQGTLMRLRMAYRPGLSAQDLIDMFQEAEDR